MTTYSARKIEPGDYTMTDGSERWTPVPFWAVVNEAGQVYQEQSCRFAWAKKSQAATRAAVLNDPSEENWSAFLATHPPLYSLRWP